MRVHALLAATIFCALCASVHAGVPKPADPGEQPEVTYRYPLVTAPRLNEAPTIDGEVDAAEWSRAAQSTGLVEHLGEKMVGDEATWWVGYTDEALHIAFRFERPRHALEPKAQQDAGHAVWSDDKLELILNARQSGSPDYNFVVNVLGAGGGQLRVGSERPPIEGPWTSAAQRIAYGWEGELTIPFTTLGQGSAPEPGTVWDILVCRNRVTPSNEVAVSSFLDTWHSAGQMGYLRFGTPHTPAARLQELGPVNTQDNGAVVELVGGDESRDARVRVALYRATGPIEADQITHETDIIVPKTTALNAYQLMDSRGVTQALEAFEPVEQWDEQVTVPADRSVRLPATAATGTGDYLVTWRITDEQSGALLSGGAMPFEQRPVLDVSLKRWLLVAKCLAVEAAYPRATGVDEDAQIVAELLDADGDNVLERVTEPADPQMRRNQLRLPTEGRLDQSYQVRVRMTDAEGAVLNEVTQSIDLPAKPEWFGNDIGITDEVMPPWEPIAVDGDAVRVVLREYELGDSGLPRAITARDKALLDAPIALTLGGETLSWTRQLTSQTPGKVAWTAEAQAQGVDLTLKTTMEYDGMVRYDLTLAPRDGETHVQDLSLSIPYRAAVNIDELTTSDAFTPYVMLGDYERGLCWFSEWAKGWQIGEKPAVEQTERGEVIDWTTRFIGAEGKTIAEPLTLTFGLQAMPVKPLDNSFQYDKRRAKHINAGDNRRLLKDPRITETDLRYPLPGNVPPEAGSLMVIAKPHRGSSQIRVLRLGEGEDALSLWRTTERLVYQYDHTLLLRSGEKPVTPQDREWLAAIHPIHRAADLWEPIGLAWQRDGEQVRIEMATVTPSGDALTTKLALPWARWQKALAGESLTFGGRGAVSIDHLAISHEFHPGPILAALMEEPITPNGEHTLVDPLEDLRFYRAKYISRPAKITEGRGGVAGAEVTGSFVEQIEGRYGKAVMLPSDKLRTVLDYGRSLGIDHGTVSHEQYHRIIGYYGQSFAPDPFWRQTMNESRQQGIELMFYGGFGLHPKHDTRITPFIEEMKYQPEGRVFSAVYPSMDGPAADYYLWCWKKTIDYYGVYGIKMDNTLQCKRADKNIPLGYAWRDDEGKQRGRWPFFATRELAKRFYWLFHVYRAEKFGRPGVIILHAGASRYPFVAGFTDLTQAGEGAD
ncbi:MAG: glycoside hydrolase domain-containing protein, partial [Phycisphaeraceae bacterium]